MPRSGYRWGQRNVYDPPGGQWLSDSETDDVFLPPENELQKGGAGERVMSEHQLRVQRSLQKLNIPDWYKNSSVARGPEGFLLKRGSDGGGHGWPGLSSKTTSLSSLGSTQSAAARSPTGHLLSPSPTPHVFTRWSTSRLNSGGTSTSTSPCGSTRSSFNYRQPYLGWRSQERLTRPRTPAERLAAGLLPTQQQQQQQQLASPQGVITPKQMQQDLQQLLQQEAELEQLRREDEEQMRQVPNLSEVRTSIKEVTSAIVHYVSGVRDGSGEALAGDSHWDSLSPPRGADWGIASTPRGTPRGSSGRLCWLESSFVGTRPLDSPETPLTLTSADVNKTLETLQQQQDGGISVARKLSGTGGPADLYLDLGSSQRHQNVNTVHHHQVNGEYLLT